MRDKQKRDSDILMSVLPALVTGSLINEFVVTKVRMKCSKRRRDLYMQQESLSYSFPVFVPLNACSDSVRMFSVLNFNLRTA